MGKNNLPTLGILITTMNGGIEDVKSRLLPQLKDVDQIVIAHQITDNRIAEDEGNFPKNVVYCASYEPGLSKNRNNALRHCITDIFHICDDDLQFIPGFVATIKNAYTTTDVDILTFQALTTSGAYHYPIKAGKHSIFSVGRVSSRGITGRRKSIQEKGVAFDTRFGLGAPYIVGEENIFLRDAQRAGLKLMHSDQPIVVHPDESSGIQYRDALIFSRIQVFKRMYGFLGGLAAIPYFAYYHYALYRSHTSVYGFLQTSFKSLRTDGGKSL